MVIRKGNLRKNIDDLCVVGNCRAAPHGRIVDALEA